MNTERELKTLRAQVDRLLSLEISKNGWITADEIWTYASATTFTVSGNLTTKYTRGIRIKLTQTTVKYFYVISSSYAAPNTTVTIFGGSDYSLTNTTINFNYYSLVEQPIGFPIYHNYTPVWTTTNNPQPVLGNGSLTGIVRMQGPAVQYSLQFTIGTTTTFGTNTWIFTLPIIATNTISSIYLEYALARINDASAATFYFFTLQHVTNGDTNVRYFIPTYQGPSTNITLNASFPMVWTTSDNLYWTMLYL